MTNSNPSDAGIRRFPSRAVAAGVAVLFALVAAGCVPVPPPGASPPGGSWQLEMLGALNAERAAVGAAPLVACAALDRAAQDHSADQAAHNKMSHTGSDGSTPWQRMNRAGYYYNAAAENVAAGQSSVGSVMSAWMSSSGHRANILSSSFVHVGVGLSYSAGGTPYWTQVFGRGGSC